MASFYRLALFPLPMVMKKVNHTMPSFVLIGDFFDFSSDLGCTSCLHSLPHMLSLSEPLSRLLLCSSAAAGGMEIKI